MSLFCGFVSHHQNKYLSEIIFPKVGWCLIGTFTNPRRGFFPQDLLQGLLSRRLSPFSATRVVSPGPWQRALALGKDCLRWCLSVQPGEMGVSLVQTLILKQKIGFNRTWRGGYLFHQIWCSSSKQIYYETIWQNWRTWLCEATAEILLFTVWRTIADTKRHQETVDTIGQPLNQWSELN